MSFPDRHGRSAHPTAHKMADAILARGLVTASAECRAGTLAALGFDQAEIELHGGHALRLARIALGEPRAVVQGAD